MKQIATALQYLVKRLPGRYLTWPQPISIRHLGPDLYLSVLEVEAPGAAETRRLDWVDDVVRRAVPSAAPEVVSGANVPGTAACG